MTSTGITASSTNVCLRIELADVQPSVLRRVEVPTSIKLSDLHLVIQAVMPWWNYHLYEFRAGDVGWGVPDLDFGDGPLDAKKSTLADALKAARGNRLAYLYDFGDGWEHTITVEYMIAPGPGVSYPVLLEASGRCPPEDVGGPPGYEEYLQAIANPRHKRYAELVAWRGPDFNPKTLDVEAIKADLKKVARKLSRAKGRTTATTKVKP
jgi:Plasmid pRiA4b ORF-3-like protein